jgi:conjugal transfer pilus assembly protein TrbC
MRTERTPARIARLQLRLKTLAGIALAAGLAAAPAANAQGMVDSIRTGWSTYIFVSTTMPRLALVDLAREASQARATLVLRGFATPPGQPVDLPAMQRLIAEIDAACCDKRPVAWMVDPKLFDRYRIRAVPSFVLADGTGADPRSYSLVTGDMALANALKFFAQTSALPAVRDRAAALYALAYAGAPTQRNPIEGKLP